MEMMVADMVAALSNRCLFADEVLGGVAVFLFIQR